MAYVMVDALTAGFLTRAGDIWDSLREPIYSAIASIQELDFWSVGAGIVDAITGGLMSSAGRLAEQAWSLGKSAIQSVKDAIGWASPPKAFTELGEGSAAAFLNSLSASLPKELDLSLSANVAANDVARPLAAPVAAFRTGTSAGTDAGGAGLWDRVLSGLGAVSGPANDVVSSVAIPAAVGADFSSMPPAGDLPSSTQRLTVERGGR